MVGYKFSYYLVGLFLLCSIVFLDPEIERLKNQGLEREINPGRRRVKLVRVSEKVKGIIHTINYLPKQTLSHTYVLCKYFLIWADNALSKSQRPPRKTSTSGIRSSLSVGWFCSRTPQNIQATATALGCLPHQRWTVVHIAETLCTSDADSRGP